MEYDSNAGSAAVDDFTDVLEMYYPIQRGYHTLVEESIATEEKFLEFVLEQEQIRQQWFESESENRRLHSMYQTNESESAKNQGMVKNIRQQLQSEMQRRTEAEQRSADLEHLLNSLGSVLNGDRTITDEDRQRLKETADDLRFRKQDNSRAWNAGMRKSEDLDDARISYDGISDEDGLEDESEEENANIGYPPDGTTSETTRRVSATTANGEYSKFTRVSENMDGDIEIVSKTSVIIPENGPVQARSSLTTRPRRSVGFKDPIVTTSTNRRSHSVPRFLDSETDGNLIRRSKEERRVFPSEVPVPESDIESIASSDRGQTTTRLNRRSRSVGVGLDMQMHDFKDKTFLHSNEICARPDCRERIKFAKSVKKCSACQLVCHPKCQGFVPVPCAGQIVDPNGGRAGGSVLELAKFAPTKSPRVPFLLVQCVKFIESRGLSEEGLYRVPGSIAEVRKLKCEYFKKTILSRSTMENITDVHVVCSVIKNFLNSLKEPLITHKLWKRFSEAAGQSADTETYRLIGLLPDVNRDTLAYIMLHLRRVADAPTVRMPTDNLVKTMAPSLIGYGQNAATMSQMEHHGHNLRQQLIMAKLFSINRKYWNDMIAPEPIMVPSTSRADHQPRQSPASTYFDAPDDSMVSEGGPGLRGQGGNNSFTDIARSIFTSSSSRNDNRTMRNQPAKGSKFQSPMMSD